MDYDQHRPQRRLRLIGPAGPALPATRCATATNELNPGREALKVAARRKVTLLRREGRLMQVICNGHALYYFQADTGSSDAYGQEQDQSGAGSYALSPAGNQAADGMQKGGNGHGS